MVTIINYKERRKEYGTSFFVLEISGGIEMIESKQTGNYYATNKRAFIPSTFDEITCQSLLETQMPCTIIKQECEPYEYTVKDTGEVLLLAHRFVYTPDEDSLVPPKVIRGNNENKPNYAQRELAENHSFSLNEGVAV